ncbi:OmpA family protein [Candidatus Dependentiae bacterium]|nr:OmpA family protein [Candidatus Dependentiae bacterium]
MMGLRNFLVASSLVLALLISGCGKKKCKRDEKVAFGEIESSETLAESKIPVLEEEIEDFFEDDESISEFAFVDDDLEDEDLADLDDAKLAENAIEEDLFDEDEFEDEDSFVAWDEEEVEELNFKTVQFDINKNDITQEQKELVKENIQAAKDAVANGKTVIVQGHCCQLGSASYNIPLSERRAEAIKAEMVRNGIPEDKIRTIGYGQEMPVVWSEKTEKKELVKELAPNRRAEITVG